MVRRIRVGSAANDAERRMLEAAAKAQQDLERVLDMVLRLRAAERESQARRAAYSRIQRDVLASLKALARVQGTKRISDFGDWRDSS